ncbi:DoxX family protein [Paracoccus sp. (in: a-proteobacteria)]|uniref:DoxX family protein n=1 Tax=Paracoccus sp. TaxID=267 RepID=UPI003A8360B1
MTTTNDHAAAALRVLTGVLFLIHGWRKIAVFTIPGTVAFFESLGLPGFVAYLIIFAEIAGGLALILGIATRIVSLALIPVLLGAAWVHSGNGFSFSGPGGGWEYPFFWAVVQGAVAVFGSGSLALRIPLLQRRLGQFA